MAAKSATTPEAAPVAVAPAKPTRLVIVSANSKGGLGKTNCLGALHDVLELQFPALKSCINDPCKGDGSMTDIYPEKAIKVSTDAPEHVIEVIERAFSEGMTVTFFDSMGTQNDEIVNDTFARGNTPRSIHKRGGKLVLLFINDLGYGVADSHRTIEQYRNCIEIKNAHVIIAHNAMRQPPFNTRSAREDFSRKCAIFTEAMKKEHDFIPAENFHEFVLERYPQDLRMTPEKNLKSLVRAQKSKHLDNELGDIWCESMVEPITNKLHEQIGAIFTKLLA